MTLDYFNLNKFKLEANLKLMRDQEETAMKFIAMTSSVVFELFQNDCFQYSWSNNIPIAVEFSHISFYQDHPRRQNKGWTQN